MEFGSYENMQDKSNSSSKHGVTDDVPPGADMNENTEEQSVPSAAIQKVHNFSKHEDPAPTTAVGELNMEVSVTADDVLQAGGFGATDDINSILPGASDFTDFEDHLRKVHGYGGPGDNAAGGQSDPPADILEVDVGDIDNVKEHVAPESNDAFEAVNMEASVTPDEMIRAGGFGAKDDISSFLPVASDFTDFEANLREARDYEGLDEEIKRPGLGWTNETK